MGRANKLKEMFSALHVVLIENDEELPATDVEDIEDWEITRKNPNYKNDVDIVEENENYLKNLPKAKLKKIQENLKSQIEHKEIREKNGKYQINKVEPIR